MRTKYKFSEYWKAKLDFQDVFKINIGMFYDGLISLVCVKICINPFKFDDYLHKMHGNYEDRGLSMMDLIQEQYGNAGLDLIDCLI